MGEALEKIKIVVLAAGHGKRMASGEVPKVLVEFKGRPLIQHLLSAVKLSKVCERPVIVIGQKAEQVMATLGNDYDYVIQSEQKGTGHAVLTAKELLENKIESVMVLYGDQPLISADTIKKLAEFHLASGAEITMGLVKIDDFLDWRQNFYDFGRVIRDSSGKIVKIIEKKDATSEELKITEVNPSYFCFKTEWLWNNLDKLQNNNAQQEYYLTDLVGLAVAEGKNINSVLINTKEALGVNNQAQLDLLNVV